MVAPDDSGRAAGSVEFDPQPPIEPSNAPAYEAPGPYPGLDRGRHDKHAERTLGQPAPRGPRWKPGREDSEPKPAAPSWQPPLSEEPTHRAEPEKQATISDAVWQAPSWLRPEDPPPPARHAPTWAPPPHETPAPTPAATWAAPATPASVASASPAPAWTPPVAEPVWTAEPTRPRTPRIPELGLEPEPAAAKPDFADDDEFVDGGFGDEFDDDEFDDQPAAPKTKSKRESTGNRTDKRGKPDKQVEAKPTPEPAPEPAPKADARPKAKPPKDGDDDFDDDFDDDDDDFDDDDASMTGASAAGAVSLTATPQPRKLPWIPISVVASVLVLISAYVFRDAIFGTADDTDETDSAGEVANTEPETPPEPPPEQPKPDKVEPPPEPPPPAIPPEELEAKLAEATDLVNRQKHADATVIIDEILGKIPKQPRALSLRAITQLEKRKYEEALGTANDCVAADANQAMCWITIAVVEQENDNLARALEGYQKYLELEPDGRFAKVAKGQVERLAKAQG